MALYNPGFSNYQNQYSMNNQQMMASMMQPMVNQGQFQIQNGGFISISSEAEARKYPVAPGNSVMFRDENAPYVYTKTMGFSQLDRPLFEKFRLVKEDDTPTFDEKEVSENNGKLDKIKYLVQEDLTPLVEDIKQLETKIKDIDSVLEELKSSCSTSVKQVVTTAKSSSKSSEKGGK